MLSGFNTNIRHRGVLFHVQSEDSGRSHPHVITHLYHGGTILASEKASYAAHLDAPDLPRVVRDLMERQHKAVLQRLRSNGFDDLILERLGAGIFDATERSRPPPEPSEPLPAATPPAGEADSESARPFGEGIVSDKPLDELILGYLVENARKRKRERS